MKKKKDLFTVEVFKPLDAALIIYQSDDFKNIHKHLNKKNNKVTSDWVKNWAKDIKVPSDNRGGGLFYGVESNKPLILFLPHLNKKEPWSFYEVLIHELNHFIHYAGKYYGFEEEVEFKAYLQESMFREIRRLIYKK